MVEINLDADSLFDDFGLKRLRDSYMLPTESSPQERFAYVCERVASNAAHAQRLYNYVSKHWLSLSTPILSLGRTRHGLPVSCYLSCLTDTSAGLLDTMREVNQLSMLGGGIGIGVRIRSADDKSTGVMAHLNTYDACSLAYRQDGVRRGSYAVYLDIDHPDIIPFIEMRKATGDHNVRCHNLHHGVNFTDKFMQLILKCEREGPTVDDSWSLVDPHTHKVTQIVSARKLWQLYLTTRMRTGEPYMCMIDTCNRLMPEYQRNKGKSIKQSNLCCVTPETRLLTDVGVLYIGCLENASVNVWNGTCFSNVFVRHTGYTDDIITITLSDGCVLNCTPNHNFLLYDSNCIAASHRVLASDLKIGDRLRTCDLPVIQGAHKCDINNPYTHGVLCGRAINAFELTDRMKLLEPYLAIKQVSEHIIDSNTFSYVPINAHLSCRVQWLAGYIDSNGIHQSNSHELEIGIEQDMLLNVDDIRYMLLGMGVRCTIRHDYKGFKHLLTISANDIVKLNELGIVTRHISLREFKKVLHEPHITVTSIVLTEHAPTVTYCFTESINHSGVFNGILTGQSEVILPTDDERTAVCCLASPNIEKYDEWQHDKLFIHDTAEMLDNCLAIFKRDAPDTLRRAKYSVECENSIGIGALGWHAFLQSKSIPFESEDARKWNVKIFCDLKRRVDEANYALGLERGSPHDAVGTGRRFCSTMAIAPNATTSIIMGNTSPGIEPYRANAYRQDTLSGSNLNKNRHLDALLKSKQHLNVDETWMSILMHDGSVQHLECLTNHEKAVFKTAFEIDQNVIIRLAADRQRFIDQSQSLNIFLRPDVPVKLLHSLHMDAWRFGLKTLYYCRSTKISTADKLSSKQTTMCTRRKPGDSTECHACE